MHKRISNHFSNWNCEIGILGFSVLSGSDFENNPLMKCFPPGNPPPPPPPRLALSFIALLLVWGKWLHILPSNPQDASQGTYKTTALSRFPFCSIFLDVLPPPTLQLGCEEFDLDSFLPAMDDVLLPYMAADDHRTSAEVTLPTLDDSVGLVPHVGSLEIMDQSLPSTSSH